MHLTRRRFLRISGAAGAAAVAGYSLWEARDVLIAPFTIPVERLPGPFSGMRVAVLADLHHGPFFSRENIGETVRLTNALQADLIVLLGDYVYKRAQYIPGVMKELGKLEAPMGVFAVKGNHDNSASPVVTSQEIARNGLTELTNRGVWLNRQGARLRLGGVDDLLTGRPDIDAALGDIQDSETALLLSHNPDIAETITGSKVGLILTAHTHGGQICLPYFGAPIVPSKYGQKYLYGLAFAPHTRVFTTRGVGAIFPPVRINCPPEIALLTLTTA